MMLLKFGFCTAFGLALVFASVPILQARTVRIAIPSARGTGNLILAVAKEKGFYQQEGLNLEVVLMNAPIANMALIGGNVEFSGVAGAGMSAALRGAPLKILFSGFFRPVHWLYARREITDIKELKGKKIAVSGIGTSTELMLRSVLKKNGLEAGRDVALLAIGRGPERYTALLTGAVDAAQIQLPENLLAEKAGLRELVFFVKEDLVELQGSVVARDDLLKSDQDMVMKFLRGTVKGLFYVGNNPKGTIPILARDMGVQSEVGARMYEFFRSAMTSDGTVDEKLQQRVTDFTAQQLGLKESPSSHQLFHYSLVKSIVADLKAKGWSPGQ